MTTQEVVAEILRYPLRFMTHSRVSLFGFHRAGKDLSREISLDDFLSNEGVSSSGLLTPGVTLYRVDSRALAGWRLHEYTLSPIGEWVYQMTEAGWGDRLPWLDAVLRPPPGDPVSERELSILLEEFWR
jgi:hypothetical protein